MTDQAANLKIATDGIADSGAGRALTGSTPECAPRPGSMDDEVGQRLERFRAQRNLVAVPTEEPAIQIEYEVPEMEFAATRFIGTEPATHQDSPENRTTTLSRTGFYPQSPQPFMHISPRFEPIFSALS